jgi:hypothetical protein
MSSFLWVLFPGKNDGSTDEQDSETQDAPNAMMRQTIATAIP